MALTICASDWHYRTEGGQHLVYHYLGTDPQFRNRILRLRSQKKCDSNNILPICDEENAADTLSRTELQPFLLSGKRVYLATETVIALGDSAIPCRPLERIKTNLTLKESTFGILQEDLVRLFGDKTLSVEIKPKSMVFSRSRLTPPEICRALKKFTISDTLVHNFPIERIEDELTEGIIYNPLDLVSGDAPRVRRALEILRESKSRWLRIFSAGHFIAASSGVARNLSPMVSNYDDPRCSLAIRLTSLALAKSAKCLSLLCQIQTLDLVDKIGLELLWNRLVDNLGLHTAAEKVWNHYLEARSLIDGADCEHYQKWKNIVGYKSAEQALALHNDSRYQQAIRSVIEMPNDICARMIADALMSAVAKDCSVIVSLAQVLDELSLNENEVIMDEENRMRWRFKVHVIDMGPKPLSKISSWAKMDRYRAKQLTETNR